MPKIPNLTSKRLIEVLKKNGFRLDHTTGSHFIFYHPQTKKRAVIPFHAKDLPTGTLVAILKQAGLSRENL